MIEEGILKHLQVDHYGEYNPEELGPPKPVSLVEYRRRKDRGKWAERQLVQDLTSKGYIARRSALSGIGRLYPDVEATKRGRYAAFEVKSTNIDFREGALAVFVKGSQLKKLKDALTFIAPFDGIERIACIAVKFNRERTKSDWIFYRLSEEDYKREFIKFTPSTQSNWQP